MGCMDWYWLCEKLWYLYIFPNLSFSDLLTGSQYDLCKTVEKLKGSLQSDDYALSKDNMDKIRVSIK
jgi:hypothetical protein